MPTIGTPPPPPPPAHPQDGRTVFGNAVDTTTQAGGFYAHIWGHQESDQQTRLRDWQHLRHVPAGDRTYDLANYQDMQDFLADVQDGKLDGKAEPGPFAGVTIDHGKIRAGDRTYDLSKPEDMHALLRDAADGKLDGSISSSSSGETPPAAPQTTSTAGSSATQGTDGVDPPPGKADEARERIEREHEQHMIDQYEMMGLQGKIASENLFAQMVSSVQKSDDDAKKSVANKIG